MKNTEEFHKNLLDALEGIRNTYFSLQEPAAQKNLLLDTCRTAAAKEMHMVGENLANILDHYIQLDAIDYDWVFSFVLGRVNSEIDRKMLKREQHDDFDSKFNTYTSVILSQYELPDEVDVERYETSNRYNPSPIVSVNMALNKLPDYKVKYEDYVYIDIGSGMGRNLLLASFYPFKEIIGVELSAYLHSVAESNIARFQSPDIKCTGIRSECVNAMDFEFPQQNMILYFWHPFDENIATLFLKKLERFLAENPSLHCLLVFLEFSYQYAKRSAVFKKIDTFLTPATTVNDSNFFSITVFSNK